MICPEFYFRLSYSEGRDVWSTCVISGHFSVCIILRVTQHITLLLNYSYLVVPFFCIMTLTCMYSDILCFMSCYSLVYIFLRIINFCYVRRRITNMEGHRRRRSPETYMEGQVVTWCAREKKWEKTRRETEQDGKRIARNSDRPHIKLGRILIWFVLVLLIKGPLLFIHFLLKLIEEKMRNKKVNENSWLCFFKCSIASRGKNEKDENWKIVRYLN